MTGADINRTGHGVGAENQTGTIRVMVVDDSLIARTVLSKMLEQTSDLVLVGMANSAEDAIEKLSQIEVDIILLDLDLGEDNDLDTILFTHHRGCGSHGDGAGDRCCRHYSETATW